MVLSRVGERGSVEGEPAGAQDLQVPARAAVGARHRLVEHGLAAVDAPELLAARDHERLELPLDVDEDGPAPPIGGPVCEPVEARLLRELFAPLTCQESCSQLEDCLSCDLLEPVGHAFSVGDFT